MNPASARFRRLRELFEAAIEQEPANRKAFLERACAGDEGLRRELSSLLASHPDGDSFLETSVLADLDNPLTVGQLVGPYVVQREIGKGGMGVVYLAEDTRLQRKVALKALSPNLLFDIKQQERFRREATVAASLSHPAIATIYALEEVDGRFYIISEYVPGQTLRVELDQALLSIDVVIRWALQLAEGLAAAHEKGIVHRDLKPDNVIRDEKSNLEIVDFGLALIPGTEPLHQRLTQGGMILGTPAYMSPEQLRGESVGPPSDIFSLGVVLYEMASGEHPFQCRTTAETIAGILEVEAPKLAGLSRTAPGLEQLIHRCLEKDAQHRYRSTAEIVTLLEALASNLKRGTTRQVEGSPTLDSPERHSAETRLRSYWWVVHQTLVVLLYSVMVVVLWQVKEENTGLALLVCFFGALACAIANGILRVHLLFTAHFNRSALQEEMREARPLVRLFDRVFATVLAGAAVAIFQDHLMAGILAAVAVGYLVVSEVIEPATIRAVFPEPSRPAR